MTNETNIELLLQDYLEDFHKNVTYIQLIASNIYHGTGNRKELTERLKLMQKYTATLYGMTNAVFNSIQEEVKKYE